MKKTIIYLSLLLIVLVSGAFYELYANTNGASSQTTAPGEVTCSQSGCHGAGNGEGSSGGLADNSGGGSVTISGITGTYSPGTVYHMTVTVTQQGANKFGFNFEALDISNGNAGTFTITQGGTWIRQGVNGTRNTVSQGHSGSVGQIAGSAPNTFDFYFDWTAPASSVGPVTFYATGVAVNMNSLNDSGDQVYYNTLTVNPTTTASAQILLSRTSFNFPSFYSLASSTGNKQEFWVGGVGLTGNLTASVSGSQFAISTSAAGPWVTSIPLTATSGVVNGTGIYVQYTGLASGTQTGTITVSGGGASSRTIPLSGVVRTGATAPTFTAPTPAALNFGTVTVGSGATAPQTFTLSWANPVGALNIQCSPGFEVSTVPTYDYSNNVSPVFFGMGFTLTAYVRAKNPQAAGALNGTVLISMPGATTQTVSLSINVTMPSQLVLASTDYLSLFTSSPGTPSSTQTLSVNGSGLSSNLDVTASTNFEVSLSSGSGFGSVVSIAPSGGNVAATTVYVRYNAPLAALDFGNLIISSTGATSQNVDLNGACFGATSGLAQHESDKNDVLSIYPNPGDGKLFVKTKSFFEGCFVVVHDLSGKQVRREKLNAAIQFIDLDEPAGVYFITLQDAGKNVIGRQKFILAR